MYLCANYFAKCATKCLRNVNAIGLSLIATFAEYIPSNSSLLQLKENEYKELDSYSMHVMKRIS